VAGGREADEVEIRPDEAHPPPAGQAGPDAAQDRRRQVVDVELPARPARHPGRFVPTRVAAEDRPGAKGAAAGEVVEPGAVRAARVAGIREPPRGAERAVEPRIEER